MNIIKNLHKISSPESLQKHLLAYAKIDYIMCPDDDNYDWTKVYHYDKNWVLNGHYFKIDDSCGDHYHILFSPDGCIIKGFDHECELSPYNFDEDDDGESIPEIIAKHNFYDNTPVALQELLNDLALEKEIVTFCTWQSIGETEWHFAPFKIPENWSDGINTFLGYTPNLQGYQKWFEDYYETNLDFDVLEQIYNGETITEDMVRKLNPEGDTKEILGSLSNSF